MNKVFTPIFLSAQTDPAIILISFLAILLIIISFLLKRIHQPYIIGYILAGVILGESGLGIVTDLASTQRLGEIGIILLLFFIGMEISLPELVKQWKVAVAGTLLQVFISVAIMLGVGYFFDWNFSRSIVLGFIIALSSSAIVIKLLEERNLLDFQLGKDVLSILLMQDIIIVPLLIISTFLGGAAIDFTSILLMIIGGLLIISVLIYIYIKRKIDFPFSERIRNDHELQVFAAIFLCFGGALLSSLFGLSAALGAFVGGMVMHAAQSTDWIHDTLHSFRVLFVAIFFISIGLQIDFNFIYEHLGAILTTLVAVYLTNHLLNSLVLRLFNESWEEAFLGGALLAQIGELSFLLATTAFHLGIFVEFGYNFTISLISLTLFFSPFWIALSERLVSRIKTS